MAQSIEQLLEALEEVLESGAVVPLSGGRRVVDVDEARDIIDEIREKMPDEINQARAIVADRNNILSKAKRESEETVRAAEEKARIMISKEEIFRQAQEQSKELLNETTAQAMQIRATVTKYCDNMLASVAEQMDKSTKELKLLREKISK
ncbi:MAG: ATPase [Oscillospiraceae bacterium]|nr:ATPase [Oscillospiraceae bacterium]